MLPGDCVFVAGGDCAKNSGFVVGGGHRSCYIWRGMLPHGEHLLLADTSVAQLLADAYKQEFSGSLIFEDERGSLSAIRFWKGEVVQAGGSCYSTALARGALGMFLPEETLSFVDRHAHEYQVDSFAAVAQLALLPQESLRAAREAFVQRGVEKLARLGGGSKYRFRPGGERLKGTAELDPPMYAWNLAIAAALADERQLARPLIQAIQALVLTVSSEARFKASLTGPARAVVEALGRQPRSVLELERLDLAPKATLWSIVYALWSTGQFMAVRPSQAPASEPLPSGSAREHQERALEDKLLEAWVLAEADQRRVEKASAFAVKAVAIFPRNARLQYYSACLHQRAQRLEEAKNGFTRALQLDPNYADARRELLKLQALADGSGLKRFFGKS